jgi:hypothetical protein
LNNYKRYLYLSTQQWLNKDTFLTFYQFKNISTSKEDAMTNFETFIVVMATLLPILFICGIMVFAGLKQSKEAYEVFYKPGTFDNPALQYFLSVDCLAAGGYLFISIFAMLSPLKINIAGWDTYLVLFLIMIVFGSLSAYLFFLLFNYWKYTKDVIIRFEPSTKTIYVSTTHQEYILRGGDIVKVDFFTNDRPKIQFSYYQFTLQNGEKFILTERTRGVYGILEYFKKIPTQTQKQLFPLIR